MQRFSVAAFASSASFFALALRVLSSNKSDEASIRGLFTAYQSDWNHHDIQAMGNLFTEDAEWINIVGMHWRGKPDIVKVHEVYHRLLFAKTDIKFTNIVIRLTNSLA